jgi:3-mercaptopyruvate sulfurtransferase SseA
MSRDAQFWVLVGIGLANVILQGYRTKWHREDINYKRKKRAKRPSRTRSL